MSGALVSEEVEKENEASGSTQEQSRTGIDDGNEDLYEEADKMSESGQ